MHRYIQFVFVISALVILILCSACTSQPPAENKGGGLTQISVPVDTSRISYEAAQRALEGYQTDSINGTADINSVYYIVAKDVDESGNATSWVFGIKKGEEGYLLVYDRTGWTVFPWSTQIRERIGLDQIISPDALFARNKAVIITSLSQTVPERKDLELHQGVYTFTIYSGSTNRILTFNATTGALIT